MLPVFGLLCKPIALLEDGQELGVAGQGFERFQMRRVGAQWERRQPSRSTRQVGHLRQEVGKRQRLLIGFHVHARVGQKLAYADALNRRDRHAFRPKLRLAQFDIVEQLHPDRAAVLLCAQVAGDDQRQQGGIGGISGPAIGRPLETLANIDPFFACASNETEHLPADRLLLHIALIAERGQGIARALSRPLFDLVPFRRFVVGGVELGVEAR